MRLIAIQAQAAVAAAAAAANPLSRILAKSGLAPQDANIMRKAEQPLLAGVQGGTGRRAERTNPDSGADGEVRMAGMEGPCLLLQHRAFLKDSQDP
ncbi:hypothetical protein [Leisingera methylohalidivorans]|uniref:Secreted protein n=1 Tax=Leisingera methylohalidivorans DSM 14336 TaxID=999552 RepID=V9W123_9RHOB|nr:hypothetical protein [Leisingera methylohalidivorans]AHD02862.1 hypothetical protein METH_03700 [Leisingera methylohalidivorans DSM 14336]